MSMFHDCGTLAHKLRGGVFAGDPVAGRAADLLDRVSRMTSGRGTELDFLALVEEEFYRARKVHPHSNVTFIALAEEVGELAKALMDEQSSRVVSEAVQVAVMAMRIVVDGDRSVDAFRRSQGLDTLANAGE